MKPPPPADQPSRVRRPSPRGAGGNWHGGRRGAREGREESGCVVRARWCAQRDARGARDAKPRTAAVSHRGRCSAAARAGRRGGTQAWNAATEAEWSGCNGGRARCPHRASCAALRARAAACKTLSVCYLPSRAPRWRAATGNGAAARAGAGMPSRAPRHVARRRDGDIAPYRNGTVQ